MNGLLSRAWRWCRRPPTTGDLILTDQDIAGARCWTAMLYADTGDPSCLRLTLFGSDLYQLVNQAGAHAGRLDIQITAVYHGKEDADTDHEVPDDWDAIASSLSTYYGWT